jgi:hypothetical protein
VTTKKFENVRFVLCLRGWGVLVADEDKKEYVLDENGIYVLP